MIIHPLDPNRQFFVGCIGLLYIVGLAHGELHHLVFNTVKYFYILPTYVFIFGMSPSPTPRALQHRMLHHMRY